MIRIPGYDDELPIATEQVRWLTYSMRVAAELSQLHANVNLDLVEFPEWGCEAYIHLLNQTAANRIPTAIHLHGPIVMFAHAIGWPDPNSEFLPRGPHDGGNVPPFGGRGLLFKPLFGSSGASGITTLTPPPCL